MSRSVSALDANTDVWSDVWEKTNEIANLFSISVTAAANSTGDSTTGNVSIVGTFSSNVVAVANTLRGGTVAVPAALEISSNLTVNSAIFSTTANTRIQSTNTIIATNSSVAVVTITGNSSAANALFGGTNFNVLSNVFVSGVRFQLPSGNTGNRPAGVANGAFRYNTDTDAFEGYIGGAWQNVAGTSAIIRIQDTEPSTPQQGMVWYDTNNAIMYVWYEDVDSQQWIDTSFYPDMTEFYTKTQSNSIFLAKSGGTLTGPLKRTVNTLTWSANLQIDFDVNDNYSVTILNNTNFDNPNNAIGGAEGHIQVIQGNGGGWTVTYSSSWRFPNDTPPAVAPGSGTVSRIDFWSSNSTFIHTTVTANVA